MAGVQLSPGHRGPLCLHRGGASTDHVLAGRQDQTAPAAVRKSPEHDPVYPGAGPADPERPAVRGENGGPAERSGDQVPTGGGEPQAEHCQAIQGLTLGNDKAAETEEAVQSLNLSNDYLHHAFYLKYSTFFILRPSLLFAFLHVTVDAFHE